MSESHKKYYSKILLLGEYTVTLGFDALAIPYAGYSGYWDFSPGNESSTRGLQTLFNHIVKTDRLCQQYDVESFKSEFKNDLFFSSNIPSGYGLGSSGAVVAAFYDRYALQKTKELVLLKSRLAALESAFHGASSGIDPLVSFLNVPLKTNKDQIFILPGLKISGCNLYLIDTGAPRQTAHLMAVFKNNLKNNAFSRCLDKLCLYNLSAINALETNKISELQNAFFHLSSIQFNIFAEMIPDKIKSDWEAGLNSGKYFFKLCGAGGGGMLLCLVTDIDFAIEKLDMYQKTLL